MKNIFSYVLIGLFLIIGLKSCIVTFVSIDDYIMGELTEENGVISKAILTPKREIIIYRQFNNLGDFGIYKMNNCIEATHYLLGLYCFGNSPFGLRYYHNADKVIDSEVILTKNIGEGYPKIGESFKTKIVVFKDKVIIGEKTFKRIFQNEEEKNDLINLIEKLKSEN